MSIIDVFNEAQRVSKIIAKNGKDPSRSSKRTDSMNDKLIEYLKTIFVDPKYSFEKEVSINCSRGKKFKIDVVVYLDKKPYVLCLLKAIQSSYNKNRYNYANTTVGETSRIYDHKVYPKNLHSVWIDWIPNEIPVYNKEKVLIKTEKPQICDLDVTEKRWNETLKSSNSSVYYSKIKFNYDFAKSKHSKVTGEKRLKKHLERLK